jgi:hypothetical protein
VRKNLHCSFRKLSYHSWWLLNYCRGTPPPHTHAACRLQYLCGGLHKKADPSLKGLNCLCESHNLNCMYSNTQLNYFKAKRTENSPIHKHIALLWLP